MSKRSALRSAQGGAAAAAAADSPAVKFAPGAALGTRTGLTPAAAAEAQRKDARRKRGIELTLIVVVSVFVAAAMAITQYSMKQSFSFDIATTMLAVLAIGAIINVALRYLAPQADPYLMPAILLLNGLGIVLIHRLDLGQGTTGPLSQANRQIIWTFISVALFIALLWIIRDHRVLSRYSYTLGLIGLTLLAIPACLPASLSEVNGSKIWIRTPFISIQPGEFSKILLIISIAAILVSKRDLFATTGRKVLGIELPRARDLAPILIVWVIAVIILVLEKDLGSSLLIFATVLVMIYIATNRVSWLLIGLIGFAVAAIVAYFSFSHVQVRFETWLNPIKYFDTKGYQLSQAMFGLGTGGIAGSGLGSGRPDLVPFASTDFIISTAGEEMGFIGLAGILILYGIIVQRCFRTALVVRDSFGKLLASGLAFTMGFQVFVVVGGVTRVIPLTGLTTPFLCYGGSSLVANYLLMALILRISDQSNRPLSQQGAGNGANGNQLAPRATRISLPAKAPVAAEGGDGAAAAADTDSAGTNSADADTAGANTGETDAAAKEATHE